MIYLYGLRVPVWYVPSLQQSERELLEVQRKLEATVHLLEEHLNKAHEDIQRMQEQYKQDLERER